MQSSMQYGEPLLVILASHLDPNNAFSNLTTTQCNLRKKDWKIRRLRVPLRTHAVIKNIKRKTLKRNTYPYLKAIEAAHVEEASQEKAT